MNNPAGSNHGSLRRSAMSASVHPLCSGCHANAALLTRSSSASSSGPEYVVMRTPSEAVTGGRSVSGRRICSNSRTTTRPQRVSRCARRLEVAVRPDAGTVATLATARRVPSPSRCRGAWRPGAPRARPSPAPRSGPDSRICRHRRRPAGAGCGRAAVRGAPGHRRARHRQPVSPRRSTNGSGAVHLRSGRCASGSWQPAGRRRQGQSLTTQRVSQRVRQAVRSVIAARVVDQVVGHLDPGAGARPRVGRTAL